MNDFMSKVQEFMRGRNGSDELALASIELAVILVIINFFANNGIISLIALALVAYAIFRIVSPSVNARRKVVEHSAHSLLRIEQNHRKNG